MHKPTREAGHQAREQLAKLKLGLGFTVVGPLGLYWGMLACAGLYWV